MLFLVMDLKNQISPLNLLTIAVETDDVYKTTEAIKLYVGKIVLDLGPLPVINTKIMACLDPDSWKTVFVDNADFMKELELTYIVLPQTSQSCTRFLNNLSQFVQ